VRCTDDSLIQFAVDKSIEVQWWTGLGFCWNWIDDNHWERGFILLRFIM